MSTPVLRLMTLVGASTLLLLAPSAHAYFDPNVGSMLLQGILAAIATVGVTAKLYWHRIRAFLKPAESEQEEPPDDEL